LQIPIIFQKRKKKKKKVTIKSLEFLEGLRNWEKDEKINLWRRSEEEEEKSHPE
jgi:hypothetical protein